MPGLVRRKASSANSEEERGDAVAVPEDRSDLALEE